MDGKWVVWQDSEIHGTGKRKAEMASNKRRKPAGRADGQPCLSVRLPLSFAPPSLFPALSWTSAVFQPVRLQRPDAGDDLTPCGGRLHAFFGVLDVDQVFPRRTCSWSGAFTGLATYLRIAGGGVDSPLVQFSS